MSDMARRLGVRGHQVRSQLVASVKMGRELHVESNIEAAVAIALDLDPRVTAIHAQPFSVRLDLLRQFSTKKEALAAHPCVPPRSEREQPDDDYVYTPDHLVECVGGRKVTVECKPATKLKKIEAKVEQWRHALSALGYRLACVTDLDLVAPGITCETTLKRALGATRFNMVCIRDARRAVLRYGIADLEPLMAVVEGWSTAMRVDVLRDRFPDHLIQKGIAAGVLGFDLKAGPLGPNSVLWATKGDLSHLSLLNLEL